MNDQTAQSTDAPAKLAKLTHWLKAIDRNKPLGIIIDIFRMYIPLALILIGVIASID